MTGFNSKRETAADKQHWNEDEWRRNNWRCGHGWLRGEQCEICNAAQPPSEWAGIKAILDEYGLQAIDFVAYFKAALAQPPLLVQEPVAWMYQCTADNSGPVLLRHRTNWAESNSGLWTETPLYTTPPQREWVGLTAEDTFEIGERLGLADVAWLDLMKAIEAKLKERNS